MSVEDPTEERECPLCLEKLEIDDLYFYPCTCKYQVCRFCWHRIRMDENGLCPACRKPYPEDPANFQPITPMEMQQKKKQKEKKKNISECRKHLSAYRVLQRNLVYVVGLSSRIADPELLKRSDYFGKYGKVVKVAVGTLPSSQGNIPVHTAYVTFSKLEEALKTIQETNSLVFDGRMIKTSLGTTKYCSNFLRGQTCNKQECMYLHEVAPPELSFTKEDMHQGKHTEYEKKLLDKMQQQQELMASTAAQRDEATAAVGLEEHYPDDEEEEQASGEEAIGSPEKESEPGQGSSLSKSPSSIRGDSIESDLLPFENIKIIDPIFPPDIPKPIGGHRASASPQVPVVAQNDEDDLGFDPFAESFKGLEALLKETESEDKANGEDPHRMNTSMSRLMFGSPMDSYHQPSSYSRNSMHSTLNGPSYLSEMDRQQMSYHNGPFGNYSNGFHNPPQQSSYHRQTSQPLEKQYYNSNNSFDFLMPRHSAAPEPPSYQPYRNEPSTYNNLMSNNHDSRDAFKALLPNVNVSFVSSSEARGLFSTSPNQFGQQQQNSNNSYLRQMYRGSGMDFGYSNNTSQQMPYASEPPGFSTTKYMTTPPPGFDNHSNHGQGPN